MVKSVQVHPVAPVASRAPAERDALGVRGPNIEQLHAESGEDAQVIGCGSGGHDWARRAGVGRCVTRPGR